jgi:hypothetical protein
MSPNLFYLCSMVASSLPFLAIPTLFIHYYARRAAWKRGRRLGKKNLGFCPSIASLGSAFQYLQVFHRPSIAHAIHAEQEEDADEDDKGQPDTPALHLNRQLGRIRRGERLETLVLHL